MQQGREAGKTGQQELRETAILQASFCQSGQGFKEPS